MFTVQQIKEHLTGMGHSGTLGKVRNVEAMLERSAAKFLLKCHPLESMRSAPLSSYVHDDLNNYALAYDFGSLVDLWPDGDRREWDRAFRDRAGRFDREKAVKNRTLSIEGSEGSKIARINWKARAAKVLNAADSVSANGTWAAVGTASNVSADQSTRFSGAASIRFDAAATGDGVKLTGAAAVDLSDEEGEGDVIFPLFLESDYASVVSVTPRWGTDLASAYWEGAAQTLQADGTAFRPGWNLIKASWKSASKTGSPDPSATTAFQATLALSGAVTNARIDNVMFSLGRAFVHKYYSKFLFKNADTGAWVSRPRTGNDDDLVVLDNDTLPLFLFEVLKDMAHQMEGTDSAFDINYARQELQELFPAYKGMYPSQASKARGRLGSAPARGRW